MNELIEGIKELNKAIRYKLSKRYCPNQGPMSPSVVGLLEQQAELNDGLIKQLDNLEYNRKVTEEEAWDLIAKKHGLKSAAQASNVFTQGKVNVFSTEKSQIEKETPTLTPDHIKALGVACGTIQRLFNEGYREGLESSD